MSNFALTMLKCKTGVDGKFREKRFCADCGFDTTVVGKSQQYSPGTRAVVCGVDWVWCIICKQVKKGEAAKKGCIQLWYACYGTGSCRCGFRCGKPLLP
jgi:hypothetical protein